MMKMGPIKTLRKILQLLQCANIDILKAYNSIWDFYFDILSAALLRTREKKNHNSEDGQSFKSYPIYHLVGYFGRNIATLCEFLAENEFELWSQLGAGTGKQETSLARSKGTQNVPKCSSNELTC